MAKKVVPKKSSSTDSTEGEAQSPSSLAAARNTVPSALKKEAKLTPIRSISAAGGSSATLGGFARELELLGYTTVEEALGVLRVAGPQLAKFLGIDPERITDFGVTLAPSASSSVSKQEEAVIDSASYALGVALEEIPVDNRAPDIILPSAGIASGVSPPGVNLIAQMPPIRNQADRGTCVAFASLAAYEHWLSRHGTPVDLSEQFLYWNCKNNDNYSGEGTWVEVAYRMLIQEGCCLEETWRYVPTKVVGNEGQGPPPPGAQIQALSYRPTSRLRLAPTSVADIKATLVEGRCVSFAIPVFNTLMLSREAMKLGQIPNPTPGEIPVGGHAMCFVGYQDLSDPGIGGGRFIVRNSWGEAFGFAGHYGPGYGTITYAYIARLNREAYAPA